MHRLLHALENLAARENAHIETEDWTGLDQLLDRQLALLHALLAQLPPPPPPSHTHTDTASDLRTRIRKIQTTCAARVRQLTGLKAAETTHLCDLETRRRQLLTLRQSYILPPPPSSSLDCRA